MVEPRRPLRLAALRAPLAVKVIGAHVAAILALAVMAWLAPPGGWSTGAWIAAVAAVMVVYVILVVIALQPVHELERVATHIWAGDMGARVASSAVAGHEVVRIGSMLNLVLDDLAAERARIRALAAEVVRAGDRERAMLAQDLQDSTAQRLAAALLQLGAIARETSDPDLVDRLASVRSATADVLEEIRLLSQTIHPRVLDDLGLPAALRALTREATIGTDIDVTCELPPDLGPIAPASASALHHVAQESLRNAVRHGSPATIRVILERRNGTARLEVTDDGQGFDVSAAMALPPIRGLFTMRERIALVDGQFEVQSAPGGGTTVSATVPVSERSPDGREENTNEQ